MIATTGRAVFQNTPGYTPHAQLSAQRGTAQMIERLQRSYFEPMTSRPALYLMVNAVMLKLTFEQLLQKKLVFTFGIQLSHI